MATTIWFYSTAEFRLRMRTLQDEDWAGLYAVIGYWLVTIASATPFVREP